MPPVTSVVARWGRALGTACRRVCFLPRDRRGRRRGAPSPAPSATRLDGFPRFRVANVIFSAAIVKVSLSLSSPRPLGLLAAAGRRRRGRRRPTRRRRPFCFSNPFTLPDSRAITHGPIVSKPWCAVSRLKRTVPVATARTRHTRISSRPAAPAAHSSHFRPARTAARTCTQVRVCLGHGRSPTSQHFTPACQHWGFRLRLASATPQGAAAAAAAASLSLF